ncbi:hypothetical protein GCM10020255_102460 [Rhodococcus baikonurensis]
MDRGALPRAVELAWGLDQPGTRGPKKGLSLEHILDTAIELADAEGVTALSMGRVAKALGFTTMSLYRYVASKDELIELISDRVIGPPPVIPDGVSWRVKLEAWANHEYATMLSRPWWLKLPITAPPTGPNNMAWLDAGLSALDGVALSAASKFQVVTNVSLFVIGRARFSADLASRSAQSADGDVAYGALIARVINREDFPTSALQLTRAASRTAVRRARPPATTLSISVSRSACCSTESRSWCSGQDTSAVALTSSMIRSVINPPRRAPPTRAVLLFRRRCTRAWRPSRKGPVAGRSRAR